MKIKIYTKVMDEKDRTRDERAYKLAKRPDARNVTNGIHYDDLLAGPGGIWVRFFIFPGTDLADIEKAKNEVISKRDVVGITLLEVPADFGKTDSDRPLQTDENSESENAEVSHG